MKAIEKAKELVERFVQDTLIYTWDGDGYKIEEEESLGNAKNCALICVENEYHAVREYLFDLMSCGVIESEKVYLVRLQTLIEEEQEVKTEIEKL